MRKNQTNQTEAKANETIQTPKAKSTKKSEIKAIEKKEAPKAKTDEKTEKPKVKKSQATTTSSEMVKKEKFTSREFLKMVHFVKYSEDFEILAEWYELWFKPEGIRNYLVGKERKYENMADAEKEFDVLVKKYKKEGTLAKRAS